MKSYSCCFPFTIRHRYCSTLGAIAFFLVLGLSAWPSRANAFNTNGIFSPRSSEQFFQRGLDRLEQEIDQLRMIYDQDNLDEENLSGMPHSLNIDRSIEQQRQIIEQEGLHIPEIEPSQKRSN